MTILISRFSTNGFEPHFQSHLKNKSSMSLHDILEKCPNEYTKNIIKDSFVEPDASFEFEGVFAFIGKANEENKQFYLNHIKNTEHLSYFESQIHKNAICYIDDGIVYSSKNKMTIEEAFLKKYEAVFIPKSQLKFLLQN